MVKVRFLYHNQVVVVGIDSVDEKVSLLSLDLLSEAACGCHCLSQALDTGEVGVVLAGFDV